MNTGIQVPKPKRLFEDSENWFTGDPPNFIETPLEPLNEIIVGLPESELILIAAKPSQGKTALAMQIAADMAHNGQACGFFSMEMSRKSLGQRLACSVLGIDSNRLRRRARAPLSAGDIASIEQVRADLNDMPLLVDDRGGLSAEKIYATALQWKQDYDVKAIFLDYVQLIEADSDNRQESIGAAARVFKQIAKELVVPFVALSQVNRAIDSRDSRIPLLSDLRDSGQLEQVADTVLMFSYPNGPDDELDTIRECQIHVKKQRNGPTGIAHVQFNKRLTKFEPLDSEAIAAQQENRVPSHDGDKPKSGGKAWKAPNKEETPS